MDLNSMTNQPISIVNYGYSNYGSICNMLKRLKISFNIITDASEICLAKKIILPGVGSFDNGVTALKSLSIFDAIKDFAANPENKLLGICLGMQLLGEYSEEGSLAGLNLIPGHCRKFIIPENSRFKVPHMCWNYVIPSDQDNELTANLPSPAKFYFVHSYYFNCSNKEDHLGTTTYISPFASVIGNSNVFGVQFHPEKSHKYGLKLLSNFAGL